MKAERLAIGVQGATGRMGVRIIQLIGEDPALVLATAIDRADHPRLGEDVGAVIGLGELGVPLTSTMERAPQVLIDFSAPQATLAIAKVCVDERVPLVVGTTGFEPDQRKELEALGRLIPLFHSPNMSRCVNLLMKLVGDAARALGTEADVEIVERHHHFKKDAPSGTAVRLAEVVGKAIGSNQYVHGRSGLVGERPRGEIGIHALRVGDNPGEHTIVFGLMGETLELTHRALNRDGFARGAIDAAKFLVGKPPGLFGMADLLSET